MKEKLEVVLDLINEGLGEWQYVERIYCPEVLSSFKKAQTELEKLIEESNNA